MKELSIEEKAKRYDEAKYIMEEYLKSGNAGVIAENTIKHAFPELKEESEDERIVKELLTFFRESIHGGHILTNKEYDSWIAWLEKQGEKESTEIRTTGYWNVQEVEQKPTDEVEPKFKVEKDKWYICTSQYCNCIEGRVYKATSDSRIIDDFGTEYDMHSDAYKYFRLWTIKDAKAGDVLSYRDGQWCFIYKGIVTEDTFKYYALLSEKGITVNDAAFSLLASCIIPATKEQCNLLFQKMKEAGYEWDAERKKLKKVKQNPYGQRQECTDCQFNYAGECKGSCQMKREKQNPAWSEEDERIYQSIIDDTIQENQLDYKQINWLKSLKERVQPKQEWSDVDKDILFRTIDSLKFLRDTISKDPEYSVNIVDIEREITLLESIKDRYTWKPSDDQMKALGVMTITGGMPYYAGQKLELISLYNDLKKL